MARSGRPLRTALSAAALCWVPCGTVLAETAPEAPAKDWVALLLLRFDELPISDSSQVKNPVTARDTNLTQGRFGRAFDCTRGGTVDVRLGEAAQPVDQLTLECWFRLDERSEERLQRLVFRSGLYGFYITGRKPVLSWFVKSAGNWQSVGAPVSLGTWTHAAGVFDGKMMRLYLNGTLAAEKENPGVLERNSTPLAVGTESRKDLHRFLGAIDEVRLSSVARMSFMTGVPLAKPRPTTELKPASDSAGVLDVPDITALYTATAPRIDGRLDDPVWRETRREPFVDTIKGTGPETPTSVRLAYDDRALYVAYRCIEKGQETQRAGPSGRDDGRMFAADCVETFVQPGGAGSPYYQIVGNTAGGIFDLKWPKPGQREPWDGKGIKVAGDMGFDVWTLELAVPFDALGVQAPQEGVRWRGNFCRQEIPSRELTAWAFTGGGFHIVRRFGTITFTSEKQVAREDGRKHELRGFTAAVDGEPVPSVRVCAGGRVTRTDAFGAFRFKDLPAGAQSLSVVSPRYEHVKGIVEVKKPVEILAPLVLRRIDPYRPRFSGPLGEEAVTWLNSSVVEPPDMIGKPSREDAATKLALLATPGEYESRAVVLYANRAIPAPRADIDALRGDRGAIARENIDVRWTQRLLKRVQYRRQREDAVFSWRFLWREAPERIEQGHLRHLVLTVKVPESAAAGRYTGQLVVTSAGRRVAALPVELKVTGFRLVAPPKKVGCYYSARGLSDDQIHVELEDIREHGGTVLVWSPRIRYDRGQNGRVAYDTGGIRRAVMLQEQHGIGPPFLVYTAPIRAAALAGIEKEMSAAYAQRVLQSGEFRTIYAGAIQRLQKLEKELNAGEFVYTWMDEVFGRGRFEPWKAFATVTRALCSRRIYITFHNREQQLVDAADPFVDIRCYHGHTLDWWLGEGHTFAELKRELEDAGDEAWTYYNIREIAVTSEWVRLCNGYWLWRSPLAAHVPWKYYSYGGSPFDDLDSDRHDFAYAAPHPTKPRMVSTLEWESFREGYDDLRYVATLQHVLGRLPRGSANHDLARKARGLVKGFWDADPRVPVQAERLSAEDYAERREAMATLIEGLQGIRAE